MRHVLESNASEQEYFERANKHGKAVWRRIVRVTTGDLPSWAEVATRSKVVTQSKVVTDEPLPDPTDDDLNALFETT
ncbi:hypothetical protein SB768_07485 [Burkholderia sp. SIMBA_043]|uniref:hypothetical protein n=1 Tax=Burkholderia TaxID=32008 RepID=UPI0005D8AFA2|nr:hypothetical protein [Burkholderia vietnamiensis]AJY07965.1 hypothetical protein AK36_2151 [Burkholderia vietnamiensis LMG 10929]AVR17306.1 hypothetical protein A8H33_29200 [Burkholderia vietnamiensis]KVM43109.1 hypothetical protein WJ57_28250 [Burkholderia vietnamiensis]KVS06414.1 hypothetical protein WK30_00925 [Burkholderia vietnamiensis]UBI27446.1 hypothetical protein LA325_14785 [Burkholderia vietnamiensis]